MAQFIPVAKAAYDTYQNAKAVYDAGKTVMSYGKRAYAAVDSYNKSRRTVGGRVLTYRPSAPVYGSSRWNASMSQKGLNRRGVASQETGFVDLAAALYNFDATGSIALIATVPQGASVSQRVGKKIILKSLQCRGSFFANSTATINDIAMLIVYDKRPTGSLPAITDILTAANNVAFNNDANSGRFVIMKRTDEVLVGNSTAAANLTERTIISSDFYLDLKSMPVAFKAAGTGAIGDIEQGALYLITVGSNSAGTTAATASIAFRTRFVDV